MGDESPIKKLKKEGADEKRSRKAAAKAAHESIIVYGVTKNGKSVTWVNFSGSRCVDSRANTIHVKKLYEGKA